MHHGPAQIELPPRLTDRFQAAVGLAIHIHGHQRRPGTEIPYLAHLFVVTGLVLEDGGDETQAIAALLHDAVDEGGGEQLLARIRAEFGEDVARIVGACSDSTAPDDPRSWSQRKASYLAHLADVDDEPTLRVVLADKVHNARSIVRDYRAEGSSLWARFPDRTGDEQLRYYRALADFFSTAHPGSLAEDLRDAVGEIEELVSAPASGHAHSK